MLHRHILHNDNIVDSTDRVLAPSQVGLLSGWGVFTTLQVADGVLFAWDRHWARIKRDAAAFHVPLPDDSNAVHRNLVELVEAKLKRAMELANKLGARHTLIVGENEMAQGLYALKNMATGDQEMLTRADLEARLLTTKN